MPTISAENYLKALFHLAVGDARVKPTDLAAHLQVSMPSVTSMMRSLSERGLVDYRAYRGAALTEEGARAALRVIRKHRLVESFLVATLGYTWDEVHDEAELLEHAVSDRLAARIERALGFPGTDPHGDPIPSVDGRLPSTDAVPLARAVPERAALIVRVLEQSPDALRYLNQHGLVPSAEVRVLEVLPFDGPVLIDGPGGRGSLSRALAAQILVLQPARGSGAGEEV